MGVGLALASAQASARRMVQPSKERLRGLVSAPVSAALKAEEPALVTVPMWEPGKATAQARAKVQGSVMLMEGAQELKWALLSSAWP